MMQRELEERGEAWAVPAVILLSLIDLLEANNERLRFLIFDNHEIPNKQQIKAIVPVLCLSGYMYAHVLVHVCVKFSHQIKY